MKRLILMFLCLLLSACNLGSSQEVHPPTPVVAAPTVISPQSDVPSPTATETIEMTAVATPTPFTIDNPTVQSHTPRAANKGLTAATETQAAWVQDGSILMLDAWDDSQRELTQAHEIVELLWFSDGRHLLYVDRQEPTDPDSPPWPQHALWLVDTETAEQWQLGEPAEDLHRIGLSPGERFIRTLPGSDFGDACFMNRRLVFVELDEHYRRVALHDLRDFDSVLSDKPYWFFPEDEGEWVGEQEYEVSVTAFCLSEEMGTSEEDLALPGRYRLDLEAGTAVKVAIADS